MKQLYPLLQELITLGKQIQNKSKLPNGPKAGGTRNITTPWTYIDYWEVGRIGKTSRIKSKPQKNLSSIIKFKKSWTKDKDHGNSWIGSTRRNYQQLKWSNTMISNVWISMACGVLFTLLSIWLTIVKWIQLFLMK